MLSETVEHVIIFQNLGFKWLCVKDFGSILRNGIDSSKGNRRFEAPSRNFSGRGIVNSELRLSRKLFKVVFATVQIATV